jgi:group I intron endonuclease
VRKNDLNVSGVYQIRNMVNGRLYVGSAVRIWSRWTIHRRQLNRGTHHSVVLQRAWNKYGEDSFDFSVLEFCDSDRLIEVEQSFIDGLSPDYNIAPRAGSQLGYKHSEEARRRMSQSRPKDFSPMTGKRHAEETKKRISESRKGKGGGPRSPERLAKISAALKGRAVSEEMRQRISASLTGRSTGRGQLSEDQVREVRQYGRDGLGRIRIAKIMGITPSAANAVLGGHAYKWVD